MKKTFFLSLTIAILLNTVLANSVFAQRHLFKRIDVGTDNYYTYLMTMLGTGIINAVTESPLVEANLNWGIVSSDQTIKLYNSMASEKDENGEEELPEALNPTAHNLWSNLTAGGKIGYVSDYQGSVNYALYASAHYNFRQLRTEEYNGFVNQKTSRAQLGGGFFLSFGKIENNTRFIIDCGLRYNIPVGYKGSLDANYNDVLNKGLTSHYSAKLSFGDLGVAVGLGFNCMHYNFFKDESLAGKKNKIHEITLTISIFDSATYRWRN